MLTCSSAGNSQYFCFTLACIQYVARKNLTFVGYVKAAIVEAIFISSVTTIAGGAVHLHHTTEKVAVVGVLPVCVHGIQESRA